LRELGRAPAHAARFLLGCLLVRRRGQGRLLARIVETEAYLGLRDPASHVFGGATPRNAPLWQAPGTLYVYFVYGMHHCLNIAVQRPGTPGCVLIRAAELIREDGALDVEAARGPGRLCRALGISTRLSGRHLFDPRTGLFLLPGRRPRRIVRTRRVGIRRAASWPLRFFDAASRAVSPLK
jgi:DNA-3-methyladenine glycosylase